MLQRIVFGILTHHAAPRRVRPLDVLSVEYPPAFIHLNTAIADDALVARLADECALKMLLRTPILNNAVGIQ